MLHRDLPLREVPNHFWSVLSGNFRGRSCSNWMLIGTLHVACNLRSRRPQLFCRFSLSPFCAAAPDRPPNCWLLVAIAPSHAGINPPLSAICCILALRNEGELVAQPFLAVLLRWLSPVGNAPLVEKRAAFAGGPFATRFRIVSYSFVGSFLSDFAATASPLLYMIFFVPPSHVPTDLPSASVSFATMSSV